MGGVSRKTENGTPKTSSRIQVRLRFQVVQQAEAARHCQLPGDHLHDDQLFQRPVNRRQDRVQRQPDKTADNQQRQQTPGAVQYGVAPEFGGHQGNAEQGGDKSGNRADHMHVMPCYPAGVVRHGQPPPRPGHHEQAQGTKVEQER